MSKKFKKKMCSLYQNCSPPRMQFPKVTGTQSGDIWEVSVVFQESEVRRAELFTNCATEK